MLISEIFYSIQGEGSLAGIPSVFIRTSGCNLRCRWCDTPYASWHPEGVELSIESILAEAQKFPSRHCVLTGGEPLLARDIHLLANSLHANGFHITIETAGTIPPKNIACDLASISPKLKNSTPLPSENQSSWREKHESLRLNPEALNAWFSAYPCQFKFVVSSPDDLPEIRSVLSLLSSPPLPQTVLLMPEGRTEKEIHNRSLEIVETCKATGYRFCDRLHIRLFGNRRAV